MNKIKYKLRLIFIMIMFSFMLYGCVLDSGLSPKPDPKATYYTKKNIWLDDARTSTSTNYHTGQILPIGSTVTEISGEGAIIRFKTNNQWVKLICIDGFSCHNINEYFKAYFQLENPLNSSDYQSLSSIEKNNIIKGVITKKMSKKAVLMAYGLPPLNNLKDKNNILNNNQFQYQLNRTDHVSLYFTNNQISSIEGIIYCDDKIKEQCFSDPQSSIKLGIVNFKNLATDHKYDWLTLGVAELMTTTLGQVSSIDIVERSQLTQLLDEKVLEQSGVSDYKQTGQMIGASHLIVGSYSVNQGQLQLNARLINTETGKVLRAESSAGSVEQWNTVVESIALKISNATEIGHQLTVAEKAKIKATATNMMKMIEALSKGKISRKSGNLIAARKYYAKALIKDPENKAILAAIKDLDVQQKAIGIVRFKDNNNLPDYKYLKTSIPSKLTEIIIKISGLPLVERLNLDSALNEMALTQTEIIDPITAAKLGRLAGATSIIMGSFEVVNQEITIHGKLIETSTANIIAAESEKGTLSQIDFLVKKLAKRLIDNLTMISPVTPDEFLDQFERKLRANLKQFGMDFGENLVSFDTGKYKLKNRSLGFLDKIAELLNKYSQYRILILGHTDNIGETEYNEALSIKRANSVYRYMIQRGVSKNRLTYIGFGESAPIDDNNMAEGRTRNRRVEFQMIRVEQQF